MLGEDSVRWLATPLPPTAGWHQDTQLSAHIDRLLTPLTTAVGQRTEAPRLICINGVTPAVEARLARIAQGAGHRLLHIDARGCRSGDALWRLTRAETARFAAKRNLRDEPSAQAHNRGLLRTLFAWPNEDLEVRRTETTAAPAAAFQFDRLLAHCFADQAPEPATPSLVMLYTPQSYTEAFEDALTALLRALAQSPGLLTLTTAPRDAAASLPNVTAYTVPLPNTGQVIDFAHRELDRAGLAGASNERTLVYGWARALTAACGDSVEAVSAICSDLALNLAALQDRKALALYDGPGVFRSEVLFFLALQRIAPDLASALRASATPTESLLRLQTCVLSEAGGGRAPWKSVFAQCPEEEARRLGGSATVRALFQGAMVGDGDIPPPLRPFCDEARCAPYLYVLRSAGSEAQASALARFYSSRFPVTVKPLSNQDAAIRTRVRDESGDARHLEAAIYEAECRTDAACADGDPDTVGAASRAVTAASTLADSQKTKTAVARLRLLGVQCRILAGETDGARRSLEDAAATELGVPESGAVVREATQRAALQWVLGDADSALASLETALGYAYQAADGDSALLQALLDGAARPLSALRLGALNRKAGREAEGKATNLAVFPAGPSSATLRLDTDATLHQAGLVELDGKPTIRGEAGSALHVAALCVDTTALESAAFRCRAAATLWLDALGPACPFDVAVLRIGLGSLDVVSLSAAARGCLARLRRYPAADSVTEAAVAAALRHKSDRIKRGT